MPNCIDNKYLLKILHNLDKESELNTQEESLRLDIWDFNVTDLENILYKGITSTDKLTSAPIKDKIEGLLKTLHFKGAFEDKLQESVEAFKNKIIGDENNGAIDLGIALHEVMESVKGESDKALKNGIGIVEVSSDGFLPSLPLARVAESVGRKIAYRNGIRFSSKENENISPEEISKMYYNIGEAHIQRLADKSYVEIHDAGTQPTIKDYIDGTNRETRQVTKKSEKVVNNIKSISLNLDSFKRDKGSQINKIADSLYFTNRTKSNIEKTALGEIVNTLKIINHIGQPAHISFPKSEKLTKEQLSEKDNDYSAEGEFKAVKDHIQNTPLRINTSLHKLFKSLQEDVASSDLAAINLLQQHVEFDSELMMSLFNIKKSDDFSVDKIESTKGQNISRTTPFNDLIEYYDYINPEGNNDLYFPMKTGRNSRLYYIASVLNAHASKHNRYMLTAGEHTVKLDSEDYKRTVAQISEVLGVSHDAIIDTDFKPEGITPKEFDNEKKRITSALKHLETYERAKSSKQHINQITKMSKEFENVDFVSLVTSLQAIKDIRNPDSDGNITTEYLVSSDATASGGTLTLMQALGTNKEIEPLMRRMRVFESTQDDSLLDDVYGIMQEAITGFLNGTEDELNTGFSKKKEKLNETSKSLMKELNSVLYTKLRDFAKAPTMTFIYGQGKTSAIESLSTKIADDLINNTGDPKVLKLIKSMIKDPEMQALLNEKDPTKIENLYPALVTSVIEAGVPDKLYDLMKTAIDDVYLKEHGSRSDRLFKLMEDTQGNYFNILPATAVLEGNLEHTKDNLSKYGVPISKIHDYATEVDGDVVFMRKQILSKTVMNVSTIHSMDTAQLYMAISRAIKNKPHLKDVGVVVIHDDIRSTPEMVAEVEKEYVALTKELMGTFDTHDQILKSIAVYTPEVTKSKAYKDLRAEVDKSMEAKKKSLENFDTESRAIIGDNKWKDVSNKEEVSKTGTTNAEDTLKTLSEESDIIKSYLNSENKAKLVNGDKFEFDTLEDTITINDNKENVIEAVEHEIIHSFTAGYINKALKEGTDKRVRYLQRLMPKITSKKFLDSLPDSAKERMEYVSSFENPVERLSEFVAVMSAEKEVAVEVYKKLPSDKSRIKQVINFLLSKGKKLIVTITDKDLKDTEIDIVKVHSSINGIILDGFNFREGNVEENLSSQAKVSTLGFNYSKNIKGASLNYLNYAVASAATTKVERSVVSLAKGADRALQKLPLYVEARNLLQGIYDDHESLQQIVHTITGKNIDVEKKNKILSKFAKLRAERNSLTDSELRKYNQVIKKLSKEDKSKLYEFVTKVPLHDYFVFSESVKSEEDLDSRLKELSKSVAPAHKEVIADIIYNNVTYVRDKEAKLKPDSYYNLGKIFPADTEGNVEAKEYLALSYIKALGAKDFFSIVDGDLADLLRDSSLANRTSMLSFNGGDKLNDSLISEEYAEPVEKRVIRFDDLHRYQDESKNGWKVLRMPTSSSPGIVYRPVIDSTYLDGAFTGIKLASNDIDVPADMGNGRDTVATATGHKIVLKDHEKDILGVVRDPAQAIVKSTVHSLSIQDSKIIRDTLLKEDTTYDLSNNTDYDDFLELLETKGTDNPWFLKIRENAFLTLPKEIRAKYKPVGNSLSDVDNFGEGIDLVRKDISHWLVGDFKKSFVDNPKLKWVLRITKTAVAGAKIGMVILNPLKIAKDNASNISYLGVMGVDPVFIAKQYNKISTEFSEYTKIKDNLIQLRIRQAANPDDKKLQSIFKKEQKKLVSHPIHGVYKKGFANSLGTDLIHQNADTLSGMQSDLQTALTFLLKNKKGDKNALGKYISRLSKIGGNGEDLLAYFSNIVGKAGATKGFEEELKKAADNIAEMKTDEDVVNYVSQFMITPNSETVKLGSYATDLTDVLAKETYYRYLTQDQKLSDSEATETVIESFPDYKENMPTTIKQLSDMGILMFPAFWMRIQKVIYRMARDKPVNLGVELQIEQMLDMDLENIIDANIVNKATEHGGILHSPYEITGFNSVFPFT